MKKIILFTFCTFLPLVSHAQTAAEKALEALLKPAVKEVSVTVPVTGRGAAFDLTQATSAIKNVISRQYSGPTINTLIQKAKAENRATIPEALLAYEVWNTWALQIYNFGQDDGSLWHAYKPGIVKSGKYHEPDSVYRRLRPDVEAYIEDLKQELQLQSTSPVVLFNNEQELQRKIDTIEELQNSMQVFASRWLDPNRGSSFFTDGYEALAWLKYYYSALNGQIRAVPVSRWRSGRVRK